ncbi:hypothetical protein [Actinotignum urinale]|uniref:hypothetical protein n=1 Tax=Actinotignum urinale TaxID=190146 RepID=UPI00370D91AA
MFGFFAGQRQRAATTMRRNNFVTQRTPRHVDFTAPRLSLANSDRVFLSADPQHKI